MTKQETRDSDEDEERAQEENESNDESRLQKSERVRLEFVRAGVRRAVSRSDKQKCFTGDKTGREEKGKQKETAAKTKKLVNTWMLMVCVRSRARERSMVRDAQRKD